MSSRTTRARRSPSARRLPVVPLAVVGVVALLAVIVVVSGRGSGGGDGEGAASGISQTRPVVVSGTSLSPFAEATSDPAVGAAAPVLEGAGFDGGPVRIGADGRPKVLAFLAHWCPHCQREVPVLADWLSEHGTPADLDLYGIATSTAAERPNYPPSDWLEREGLTIPTLADDVTGSAASAFGLSSFPYFVAVSADNQVVARASGELSVAQWESLLRAAVTGTG